jgi:diadenosine tetraphosphate (Ap4A) HIT family hydrolase
MDPDEWSLHPRLAEDTIELGDLPLSRVLLMNDANYPWIVLVPRRAGAVEMVDLEPADRGQLMDEIALASRAIRDLAPCDKLNVAALGNVVSQLHVHVIARRQDDAAWPKPVWGAVPARRYDGGEADRIVVALRAGLNLP